MRRNGWILTCFLFAGAAGASRLPQSTQEKPKEAAAPAEYKIPAEDAQKLNPVKATPESLAQAKKLYGYDCEMCHGARGDGKGELADVMKLTMGDWRDAETLKNQTDGELFYIISNGKGKMTGEGDRQTADMRWKLVNLVRSFAKKDSGKTETAKP